MRRYEVTKFGLDVKASSEVKELAGSILAVIESADVNYETAKLALDYADQLILNQILNEDII